MITICLPQPSILSRWTIAPSMVLQWHPFHLQPWLSLVMHTRNPFLPILPDIVVSLSGCSPPPSPSGISAMHTRVSQRVWECAIQPLWPTTFVNPIQPPLDCCYLVLALFILVHKILRRTIRQKLLFIIFRGKNLSYLSWTLFYIWREFAIHFTDATYA